MPNDGVCQLEVPPTLLKFLVVHLQGPRREQYQVIKQGLIDVGANFVAFFYVHAPKLFEYGFVAKVYICLLHDVLVENVNGQILNLKLLLHRHRLVTKGHKGAQVSIQGK